MYYILLIALNKGILTHTNFFAEQFYFLKWTEGLTNKVRLVYAAFLWEMGNLLSANWLSKNNIW